MIAPRTTADLPVGPPAPHLIRWFMRDRGSALVFGRTGLGKTRLLWQMACAWARGEPAFTLTPREPLKITFIEADMFGEDFEELVKELRGAGIEPPPGLVWFARDQEEVWTVENQTFYESVAAYNRLHGVHLTIYDAIPDLYYGDPNDSNIANRTLRSLHRLAAGRAYLGVMVQRKADRRADPEADADAGEDMFGSQAWSRQASAILKLTAVPSLVWTKSRLCQRPMSVQLMLDDRGVFHERRSELVRVICHEAAKGYHSARELAKRVLEHGVKDAGDRTIRAYISEMESRGAISRLNP